MLSRGETPELWTCLPGPCQCMSDTFSTYLNNFLSPEEGVPQDRVGRVMKTAPPSPPLTRMSNRSQHLIKLQTLLWAFKTSITDP